MGKTVYDVLSAAVKYDGNPKAHETVIATLKTHGHTLKASSAWCSETVMAYFYDAGCIDLIGGYAADSGTIKSHAKKLGIWHSGSSGILPGDIVLYGSDGKTNHTEFAVGADTNISGNYNGGCSRRKRSGRNIIGYVRPKYATMPEMDNLQITICACDVMLGVYGSGDTRARMLSVFGSKNAAAIQAEVSRVWSDAAKVAFDMAVYISQGRAGNDTYRRNRLDSFYKAAQGRLNDIYALHTHSAEEAASDVLAGRYSTGAVRVAMLRFNGYDAAKVQAIVNKRIDETKPPDGVAWFRIYPVWFFEHDESAYGDCTAIMEYDSAGRVVHCVLIDTAMSKVSSTVIKKLKAQGVTKIDAVVISHAHGDHYGGLTNIAKSLPVSEIYLPDTTGLDKYQKSYGNAIRRQESKAGKAHYLKAGSAFSVGGIKCACVYQAPTSALKEHDDHHFVNNQSVVLRFDLNGLIFHTAGDLQNEGNNLLRKAVPNLKADIFKVQWHGDANACNDAICEAVRPKVAFSNYHHKEQSGRGTTRKRLEKVGAKVYRNAEDGDIFIDIIGGTISVSTKK